MKKVTCITKSLMSHLIACLLLLSAVSTIRAQTDTIIIQENGTGLVSFSGITANYNTGYTGSGYIDTDNGFGSQITWEICVPGPGDYILQWRYAYGKTGNRTARLLMDGSEVIEQVDFLSTGTYTSWDTTLAVALTLETGPHKIRLEATNAGGLANIDYMAVAGNKPTAGYCPVSVTGVTVSPVETTVGVKGFRQLSATVLPENATNQNVTWSSSDSTIATVNESGRITGKKEGTVNIVVTTEEGLFTDTCIVSSLLVPVYYLELSTNGEGEITPPGDSIAEGTTVCLSAIPAEGWKFDGWSGDTSGIKNPLCVLMDRSRSIHANFSENPYGYVIGFGDQSVDGYAGVKGTTGGGTASPVVVSTVQEFMSAAVGNNDPAVVIVNGRLNVGTVSIGSNKTIAGINENAGLYGGTIQVRGTNCIFQNLTIGPGDADVMELSGATNVFITKCAFHDAGDEILSIVRESDYVTVSWCKFYFDNSHSHAFGHLIGNRDDRTSDRGKLHVTMHHNWYAHGIAGRQPRVRYGHVHIYNNYYNSVGSGYCIGVGYECHLRLENIYFDGVSAPWADYGGVENGEIGWNGLKFVGCNQPSFVKNSFPVYNLPYHYIADPVDSVKHAVLAGAGNVFGTVDTTGTILVSVTKPAENDVFENNPTITLEAAASVSEGTVESVQFYQNHQLIGEAASSPYAVIWENVPAGSHKITAKAIDNAGKSTFSDIIIISVNEAVGMRSLATESVQLYPNPATDQITLRLDGVAFSQAFITLYNSRGHRLLTEKLSGGECRLDLTDQPAGIYMITLTTVGGMVTGIFVKEN